MKIINKLLIPIAILNIRFIQFRYRRITVNNYHNQSNSNLYELILLQSEEFYYKKQFSAWGKYHPSFSFTNKQLQNHYQFMDWLFPEKTFKEWDVVIWHNPEAVTYYHNKIYNLNKGKITIYGFEIQKQIEKWKKERLKP